MWDVWYQSDRLWVFGEWLERGWYVDIPQPRMRGGEKSFIELGPYSTKAMAEVIARATV